MNILFTVIMYVAVLMFVFNFKATQFISYQQSLEVYIYLTQRCAKYNLLGYRETASHSEMFCLWRDETQIVSSIYQFRKKIITAVKKYRFTGLVELSSKDHFK